MRVYPFRQPSVTHPSAIGRQKNTRSNPGVFFRQSQKRDIDRVQSQLLGIARLSNADIVLVFNDLAENHAFLRSVFSENPGVVSHYFESVTSLLATRLSQHPGFVTDQDFVVNDLLGRIIFYYLMEMEVETYISPGSIAIPPSLSNDLKELHVKTTGILADWGLSHEAKISLLSLQTFLIKAQHKIEDIEKTEPYRANAFVDLTQEVFSFSARQINAMNDNLCTVAATNPIETARQCKKLLDGADVLWQLGFMAYLIRIKKAAKNLGKEPEFPQAVERYVSALMRYVIDAFSYYGNRHFKLSQAELNFFTSAWFVENSSLAARAFFDFLHDSMETVSLSEEWREAVGGRLIPLLFESQGRFYHDPVFWQGAALSVLLDMLLWTHTPGFSGWGTPIVQKPKDRRKIVDCLKSLPQDHPLLGLITQAYEIAIEKKWLGDLTHRQFATAIERALAQC